jgi:hypothetical protein
MDKLKEKIIGILSKPLWTTAKYGINIHETRLTDTSKDNITARILSACADSGMVLLDPDQSLPEIPFIDELEYGDATCHDFRWGARAAQKELLTSGFKRVLEIKKG